MTLPLHLHSRDPQPSPTVRELQAILINKGFSVGHFGADGDFGEDTLVAVKRYQVRMGLLADGVVGPLTWAALTKRVVVHLGTAAVAADIANRLVTDGFDGRRPAYSFGAETRLTDPSPDRIDCSELIQWAVYRAIGVDWVDGSRAQYMAGSRMSVAEAIRTKGALLFISNGGPLGIHHVAMSMGNGRTAEARSAALGVGSWSAEDRGWDYACRIPVLRYAA